MYQGYRQHKGRQKGSHGPSRIHPYRHILNTLPTMADKENRMRVTGIFMLLGWI